MTELGLLCLSTINRTPKTPNGSKPYNWYFFKHIFSLNSQQFYGHRLHSHSGAYLSIYFKHKSCNFFIRFIFLGFLFVGSWLQVSMAVLSNCSYPRRRDWKMWNGILIWSTNGTCFWLPFIRNIVFLGNMFSKVWLFFIFSRGMHKIQEGMNRIYTFWMGYFYVNYSTLRWFCYIGLFNS